MRPPTGPGHIFEHFYLSLQAASAGIGVAIGSWQMVRDDIAGGALAAPAGFVDDGSRYALLSAAERSQGVVTACDAILAWVTAGSATDRSTIPAALSLPDKPESADASIRSV